MHKCHYNSYLCNSDASYSLLVRYYVLISCEMNEIFPFQLPAQDDYILSIISQVGTSISIVCLFATVFLLYIVRYVFCDCILGLD